MKELLLEVLEETFHDTLEIIPILFLAYLLMEFLEHKTGEKTKQLIKKSDKVGPLLGAAIGAVPQCGFSAAASSLYAGRVVTVGTLIAVYLSTSDEMLPIFLSEQVPVQTILKVLGLKVVYGCIAGFAIDFMVRATRNKRQEPLKEEMDIHHVCEHDHAHKEEDGVLVSALKHTLKITVFLFLISLVLNFLIGVVGAERLAAAIPDVPVIEEILAGLVGLIPNCAASVLITQLYIDGIIGTGPMMAGLLSGAGIGLMVLFREHDNMKKNLAIVGMLYGFGVLFGILTDLLFPVL